MPLRVLYGGAMSMEVPGTLVDVSDFRQVPDAQEVFVGPGEVSIIVTVLEHAQGALVDAAKFHFEALAEDSDAEASSIDAIETPQGTPLQYKETGVVEGPALVRGTQRAAKFNSAHADTVTIYMGIWRIASKNVDVSLVVNDPGGGGNAKEVFAAAQRSLTLHDMGLFAA